MQNVFIYLDVKEELVTKMRNKFPKANITVSFDRDKLKENLKDAEVVITFHFTKEMLDMAPRLKWLQIISAGVDALPLDDIFARNIILTNGRGIHRIHMAEYAMGAMISMARNFPTMYKNQLDGKWERNVSQGEVYGSTVGILGLGSIGEQIAKLSKVFGMKVIGTKRTPEPMEFVDMVYGSDQMDIVFKESDYVISLLPHTPKTDEIIDNSFFSLMKETAVFINMGRGKTVNEGHLIEVLKARKIKGFFSDVFYEEPLPSDSPLWELDNVVITPHICGVSPNYNDRAFEIAEHNLQVLISGEGEMINVVTEEKGY